MPKEKTSQTARILKALESGRSLTVAEATSRFGVTKLSARICELRNRGYDIATVQKPVRGVKGKTVTAYQLNN